jgi:DNA polymerase I-like protein with 3'-5' exonuclease and polymerase domains
MTTGGIERGPAQRLHESYWRLNWSVKKVAEDQLVKTVDDQMWLYNPVSKMWYTLRYDKDRFSTLVQSTAAFVFDLWIKYVLEQREQLTASFHDEGVWHLKEGHREEFTDIIQKAIQKVNEEVKLNRELEVDIQFGKAYSSIH